MKTAIYLLLAFLFLAASVISCSEEPKALIPTDLPSTEEPETPTNPVNSDPTVAADTALYFRLGLQWESAVDGTFVDWPTSTSLGGDRCNISVASPLAQRNITCAFSIPEARLFYSHVNFKMGTSVASACPILKFRPYYYVRSNLDVVAPDPAAMPPILGSPGYTPPGSDTAISCGDGKDKSCYGGAAPTLVPEFPKNGGLYFLTHINSESAYKLGSENSLRYYGNGGVLVNYLVTNNLDPVGRGITVATNSNKNERVEDTFFDYHISCVNYWGETLYEINLFISDENFDDSGGVDNYIDWN
ncbi:hypothetical protein AB1A81_03380 [Bdellovibrio bacteriovorus]|uniref:Lipoprotein n=1 Tax=Bdellovibrio bacteriovorus (strain ATCC 15356 / DSM 50701 / NCIMB 9529 / HD100) TaxID=264462 RepID=Q6MPV5_BDEBA|nr:hypothetical protein [Bdellovibrio bacteriovorus]CAE78692.1 hypothetical protein predicted by Glimmer/Critica [Bdellovibrio bacteriovorus HD100]